MILILNMDRLTCIVSFVMFYAVLSVLNLIVNVPPPKLISRKRWDYLGQHISMFHAITAVIICLYVYRIEGGIHYNAPTNSYHIIIISVIITQHTLGYFFYDMVYAELFKLHDWAMRTHHLCVLIGGTIMYMSEIGGSIAVSNYYAVSILITEGSNPFMMLRKILKARDLENTRLYSVNEKIFAASFIFFRSVLFTWVVDNAWVASIPFIVTFSMSLTYAVGYFWIYVIVSIAIKPYQDSSDPIVLAITTSLGFIKKNQVYFIIGVLCWSIVLPMFLTKVLNTGFINLIVNEFIIF